MARSKNTFSYIRKSIAGLSFFDLLPIKVPKKVGGFPYNLTTRRSQNKRQTIYRGEDNIYPQRA
jgi:hypothetical protein